MIILSQDIQFLRPFHEEVNVSILPISGVLLTFGDQITHLNFTFITSLLRPIKYAIFNIQGVRFMCPKVMSPLCKDIL